MPQWLIIILIILGIFLGIGLISIIFDFSKNIFIFISAIFIYLYYILMDIFKIISFPFRLLIRGIKKNRFKRSVKQRESMKWELDDNKQIKEASDDNNNDMLG